MKFTGTLILMFCLHLVNAQPGNKEIELQRSSKSNTAKLIEEFIYNSPCSIFNENIRNKYFDKEIENKIESMINQIAESSIASYLPLVDADLWDCNSYSQLNNDGSSSVIRKGNGVALKTNHSAYSGYFSNNFFYKGTAIIYYGNCDSVYIGLLDSLRYAGRGLMLKSNGEIYNGTFNYGTFINGEAIITDNTYNKLVAVNFENNTRNKTESEQEAFEKQKKKQALAIANVKSTSVWQASISKTDSLEKAFVRNKNMFEGYLCYINEAQYKNSLLRGRDPQKEGHDIASVRQVGSDSAYHGKGLLLKVNGDKYLGKFNHNVFLRGWKYEQDSSFEYRMIGWVEYTRYNGTGVKIFYDGRWYHGEFAQGKFDHGRACDFDPETHQLVEGKYREGKFYPNKKKRKSAMITATN